jgi:hypothetical protein
MVTNSQKRIFVEISVETLRRLLSDNQLCAAELNCLDPSSKQLLWKLCLETCAGKRCPVSRKIISDDMTALPGDTLPGQSSLKKKQTYERQM